MCHFASSWGFQYLIDNAGEDSLPALRTLCPELQAGPLTYPSQQLYQAVDFHLCYTDGSHWRTYPRPWRGRGAEPAGHTGCLTRSCPIMLCCLVAGSSWGIIEKNYFQHSSFSLPFIKNKIRAEKRACRFSWVAFPILIMLIKFQTFRCLWANLHVWQ